MQAKKLDPVVWIIVALVGVAVFSVLIALATRSCVLAIKEGFESTGARHSSYEDAKWATESDELEPAEYASFIKKAQAIDFGIGVHLGADMEQIEAVLGAADTVGRADGGGYEYSYLFFAEAKGPSFKQRHKGGFFSILNSASLALTAVDEKVTSITFYASSLSNDDAERWEFITLDGKPLTQCTKDDLAALLGKPTEATRYKVTWRYTLASPIAESTEIPETSAGDEAEPGESGAEPENTPEPAGGILVEAMTAGDTSLLYSLEIRQR